MYVFEDELGHGDKDCVGTDSEVLISSLLPCSEQGYGYNG